ncbi:MAG: hypothetical protein ACXIUP_06625 [Microcella sp.]
MPTDDEQLQMAADAARRLVSQSRAHVGHSITRLPDWVANASERSPCGADREAAARGIHRVAFNERIQLVEGMSNALLEHLRGLELLTKSAVLHPLPSIPIARSIAEVAASTAWLLDPACGADGRAARAYAAVFRSFEKVELAGTGSETGRAAKLRETLITELESHGTRVERHIHKGVKHESVAQVTVGRSRAKTGFQYSQRVAAEIPAVAGLYAHMSGIAHGETVHISSAFDTPAAVIRVLGHVASTSVEAWSNAVNAWVDVSPGPFLNPRDRKRLVDSMPATHWAEFEAQRESS